jgi:hypothetical protein
MVKTFITVSHPCGRAHSNALRQLWKKSHAGQQLSLCVEQAISTDRQFSWFK